VRASSKVVVERLNGRTVDCMTEDMIRDMAVVEMVGQRADRRVKQVVACSRLEQACIASMVNEVVVPVVPVVPRKLVGTDF